jgi:hypothetical protein
MNSPMKPEKCQHCRELILEGQRVISFHGDWVHEACWRTLSSRSTIQNAWRLISRSRGLLDRPPTGWSPENERDARGWPICPACKQSLRPGEGVRRRGVFMWHLDCPDPAR